MLDKKKDPSMQLDEFVAASLVQIMKGVIKAQEELKGTGGRVNPLMRSTGREHSIGEAEGDGGQPVTLVEFDVAVTAKTSEGSKGGIGVLVAAVGFGAQSQSGKSSGSESRIKFTVPILLPRQKRIA